MARTAELVLGILGGIFGLFGALAALFLGGLGSALNLSGAGEIVGLGWLAVLASIIGLVGAGIVKSNARRGGILMLISAILGLIAVSFAYLLATILLGISGLLAVFRKGK